MRKQVNHRLGQEYKLGKIEFDYVNEIRKRDVNKSKTIYELVERE